jgi:O-antigen/teichoic acid export membrane protein
LNLPRNIFYGFLSVLLPLVSTLVVTKFVVEALGAVEYGLLTLILGVVGYSFTFGISRAATKFVAQYRATGETEKINEVLAATLVLNLLIAIGGAIFLILAARFLVSDVLLIDAGLKAKAVWGFYIAAGTILLLVLQQFFTAVLQAVNRFDWFSHLTTVFSTVLSAGNLILSLAGGDAVALLWWNLIITAIGAIGFYAAARRALPKAKFGFRFGGDAWRLVWRFSAGVVGYQISGNLLLLFERVLITRRFGTESLTFYVVPMMLTIYIHVFMISLSLALMPLASETQALDNVDRLLSVYKRATKYIWVIALFACVSFSICGEAFFRLWLGAEFAARSGWIVVFHAWTFGSMSLSLAAFQITEGVGKPSRNAWLMFFWTAAGAGLMSALIPVYGLVGVAAGRSVPVVVSVPFFVCLIERAIFGKIQTEFWRKTLLLLVPAAAVAGLFEYFLLALLSPSWLSLAAATAAGGLIYLTILILTNFFPSEERNRLKQFARRALAAQQ